MKNILMASAAVLALSSAVQAEGNFQGFYAGVNGGYATAKNEFRIENNNNFAVDTSAHGFTGGVQAGYNHQIGNFVVGAEIGFNFGNLTNDYKFDANHFGSTKRKNEFLAAARAGYVVNNWMPYIKAGISSAKFDASATQRNTANNANVNANTSDRRTGFLIGAGVETVIADNFVVGAEWTTVKYKDSAIKAQNATNGFTFSDNRTQEFKVRLGYKF